jgi:hypothetical protein
MRQALRRSQFKGVPMKTDIMRKCILVIACVAALGMLAGCDKAEQALEKTDLGTTTEVTKLISNAVKSLGSITDIESARAALPALQDVDIDLGKIVQNVKDMAPEAKSKLTGVVSKAMPQLEAAIAKVSSLSGVGEIVGPTLKSLQDKFKNLT